MNRPYHVYADVQAFRSCNIEKGRGGQEGNEVLRELNSRDRRGHSCHLCGCIRKASCIRNRFRINTSRTIRRRRFDGVPQWFHWFHGWHAAQPTFRHNQASKILRRPPTHYQLSLPVARCRQHRSLKLSPLTPLAHLTAI